MPGSTPATSQLDWLSSTTAMIVLSWSKATRDLLKSFSWGIGALRQLFASDDGAISFAACPIPSLRDAGSLDRVYIVRQDEDGGTTVQFGDGLTGARVPTGINNVYARWRKGSGLSGMVKAGQLS